MSVWEYAIEKGVLHKKGTAYRYKNNIVTRNSFRQFYKNHRNEIDSALRASVRTNEH
jgi:hypothetical protein